MRALVTLVAPLELAQHLGVVRFAMTILALRDHSMLVGMTENTLESSMFGGSSFKSGPGVLMACAASKVGNICAVGKCKRLVDLMTFYAVFEFLFFNVWFMAIHAVRFVTMFVVAE